MRARPCTRTASAGPLMGAERPAEDTSDQVCGGLTSPLRGHSSGDEPRTRLEDRCCASAAPGVHYATQGVAVADSVSIARLYLMRIAYLINFVVVGLAAWPSLTMHAGPWDPIRGAAFSLYAALSTFSALGLRYTLKMIPLLLFSLLY